jgi:hypothetical protein
METSTESRALRPVVEHAVVPPPWLASPVTAELTSAGGVVRGHLAWATSCRRVVQVRERSQEVTHRKPAYETVPLNGITGLGAGLGGVELLKNRDQFSTRETCEDNEDGTTDCASPRDRVTGLGVSLVGYAIVAVSAAVVTAASRSSSEAGPVQVGATRQTGVLAEGVPCGEGPLAGLGVALYRADERIAGATVDGGGNVAFELPRGVAGPLTLVADFDSSRHGSIVAGQWLGEIVVEPTPSQLTPSRSNQ